MATIVGQAGDSAMRRAVQFSLIPVGFVVFVAMLEIPLAIWAFARSGDPLLTAIILALVLGISIWWTRESWGEMFETIVEARDWAKGAAGERAAADDLRQLPPEYLVLNDVHPGFRGVSRRWNWDHVIIGPTGLFVVDSKNYSAKRIRDGKSDARTRRNVKQVRGYAIEFKKELTRLNPDLGHEFIVQRSSPASGDQNRTAEGRGVGRSGRTPLPCLWRGDGPEDGPVRRFLRLHQLSRDQMPRKARSGWRPEVAAPSVCTSDRRPQT